MGGTPTGFGLAVAVCVAWGVNSARGFSGLLARLLLQGVLAGMS